MNRARSHGFSLVHLIFVIAVAAMMVGVAVSILPRVQAGIRAERSAAALRELIHNIHQRYEAQGNYTGLGVAVALREGLVPEYLQSQSPGTTMAIRFPGEGARLRFLPAPAGSGASDGAMQITIRDAEPALCSAALRTLVPVSFGLVASGANWIVPLPDSGFPPPTAAEIDAKMAQACAAASSPRPHSIQAWVR